MLYGLYLSATGVMTNSYRQDVIANNLANSETTGFKRDIPLFQVRFPEADTNAAHASWSNPLLNQIGGGTFAAHTQIDQAPGELTSTGSNLDAAIQGPGFFSVAINGKHRLTRNGSFVIDKLGHLVLNDGSGAQVLDQDGKPITLEGKLRNVTVIAKDSTINQANKAVAKLGVFDVPDRSQLKQLGGTLFSVTDPTQIKPSASLLEDGFLEKSNVAPASELTALMDTQRDLEANANMIQDQNQTLSELVNTVGKVT